MGTLPSDQPGMLLMVMVMVMEAMVPLMLPSLVMVLHNLLLIRIVMWRHLAPGSIDILSYMGSLIVTHYRSCGDGFKLLLPNPEALTCYGAALQVFPCNLGPCPVDCAWSVWSPWSACTPAPSRHRVRRDKGPGAPPLNFFGQQVHHGQQGHHGHHGHGQHGQQVNM